MSSARVRASVPPMSVRLLCPVGSVVFGGDGDEGLLEAETGDLDVTWPQARVQYPVQRGVGVAGLDLHEVAPDLEVHQRGQAQEELLVHLAQVERDPPGARLGLDLGRGAVG